MRTPTVAQAAGTRRSPGSDPRARARTGSFALVLLLGAGCADCKFLSQTCPQPPDPQAAATAPAPAATYRVGCPDVLEVTFADRPEWDAFVAVALDGRLPLEALGNVQAEGRTLEDLRVELAGLARTHPDRVEVKLAAARSSHVFVHGPIRGRSRVIPYQGAEPVIDMLKRVGGLPPGSKLNDVYVVRPNIAAGTQPEVFRVDVPSVLLDNDQATNVQLKPSDEVYVGETKRSVIARMLPDWLGPTYRKLHGLLPDDWFSFTRPRGP